MLLPPMPPSTPAETTLDLLLDHHLPFLLAASLATKSLVGRWRLLHPKLSLLHSAISDARRASPHSSCNPLLLSLLPHLVSTLNDLHSLSARCMEPSLPAGKLLLQSDLDVASSSLSLHLHDLRVLLSSGLLHNHSLQEHSDANAIVLPLPGPSASRAELALFVRDVFARLQIGAIDLKLKALDSLVLLLSPPSDPQKLSPLIAQEGHLPSLIRLLDQSNHSLLRDQAAAAVSVLSTASDVSRRAIFEEGGLGPLLRLLESGSAATKERAAAAIQAIAADPAMVWAISAYGGISVLISACRPGSCGSPSVQALAAGCLMNIAALGDARAVMAEEGAVPPLVDLLASDNRCAWKNAIFCLVAMASPLEEDEIRASIIQQGGLQRLLLLLREALDPELLEHALRAIHALSTSPSASRTLSTSSGFLCRLSELIKYSNAATQHVAVSVLCNLSLCEESKRSMAGCMAALVKMMELPKPVRAQEVAAQALVSLLDVRSNRKELGREEKSVTRLVHMLDPQREELCKRFPVSVVLALAAGGGSGCRKKMADAGACQHLQKLTDANVPGAKKALHRIAGGRLKNLFTISWRD